MRGHVLAAAAMAVAAVTAFAQPAAAQQYRTYHDAHVANEYECRRSEQRRTVGGAVIGGVIGALLGREVADRGTRGEGAALGAVVGATAGGALGRSTARCDNIPQGDYDPYYGDARYPQDDPYYRGGDDDLYGGPYEDDGYYRRDGRDCAMRDEVYRDRYGRRRVEEVYMCRGRDGVWRPA